MGQWQQDLIEKISTGPVPIAPVVSPLPVTETNPVVVIPVFRPAGAVHTVVPLTNVSQIILPTNLDRRRIILHNDSAQAIFVMFGSVCSTSSFSFRLTSQEFYDGPIGDYTGPIAAVRTSGTGDL